VSGRSRFKGRRAETSSNATETASVFLALIRRFCSQHTVDAPAQMPGELPTSVETFVVIQRNIQSFLS